MHLEWKHHDTMKMYFAKSSSAPSGEFRIFYDDIMYWDNFSDLSPTQDLALIQETAEKVHTLLMSNEMKNETYDPKDKYAVKTDSNMLKHSAAFAALTKKEKEDNVDSDK
jgi:hypothetical protein